MKDCRYCKESIEDTAITCPFCGYNHETNAMDPLPEETSKVRKRKLSKKARQNRGKGVDYRIKKFVYIGIGIIIFSVLYKYNFNPLGLISEARQIFSKAKAGVSPKGKQEKAKAIITSVKEFAKPKLKLAKKPVQAAKAKENLITIEGVLFDSRGTSFATINGEIYSEGQSSKYFMVKKIFNDSVELTINGVDKVLQVNDSVSVPAQPQDSQKK